MKFLDSCARALPIYQRRRYAALHGSEPDGPPKDASVNPS